MSVVLYGPFTLKPLDANMRGSEVLRSRKTDGKSGEIPRIARRHRTIFCWCQAIYSSTGLQYPSALDCKLRPQELGRRWVCLRKPEIGRWTDRHMHARGRHFQNQSPVCSVASRIISAGSMEVSLFATLSLYHYTAIL